MALSRKKNIIHYFICYNAVAVLLLAMVILIVLITTANATRSTPSAFLLAAFEPAISPMPTNSTSSSFDDTLILPTKQYWCWQCCCFVNLFQGSCCHDHD
ncbi:hypothetical protein LINPERHAP1_LOCUS25079 [Linum perenne]